MGMYTRFKLDVSVSADTQDDVVEVLQWLASRRKSAPPPLPRHALFQCARWDWIGQGAASYWDPKDMPPAPSFVVSQDGFRLTFDCALRNYDAEIDRFLEFIGPHLVTAPGSVVGLTQTEDERASGQPQLLIAQVKSIAAVDEH